MSALHLRHALATGLLGLLFALPAHAVQDCELNGESVNPANGNTTAGKSGLMRCKDRDSGKLVREQQLQNGVFAGIVRFYENGQVSREYSVNTKGNRDGRSREFAPDGQVRRDSTYSDGRELGLTRSFHPDGKIRRAAFYGEQGERAYAEFTEQGLLSALRCGDRAMLAPVADDAQWCGFGGNSSAGSAPIRLYDNAGRVRSRVSYVEGKRVRNEELYENGKPSQLIEQSGSQRTDTRWASDGVKRSETVSLTSERSSIKQQERQFSEAGQLVREQRWSTAGEPLRDDTYYLNGQPKLRASYGDGAVDITEFFDNGQQSSAGRYTITARTRQIPVGTHKRFDMAGMLRAESSYDERGRLTRERTWDATGQPERDDAVFEDGSRKAFTK